MRFINTNSQHTLDQGLSSILNSVLLNFLFIKELWTECITECITFVFNNDNNVSWASSPQFRMRIINIRIYILKCTTTLDNWGLFVCHNLKQLSWERQDSGLAGLSIHPHYLGPYWSCLSLPPHRILPLTLWNYPTLCASCHRDRPLIHSTPEVLIDKNGS